MRVGAGVHRGIRPLGAVRGWGCGADTGHRAKCELCLSLPGKMLKEPGRMWACPWGIKEGLMEEVGKILREKEAKGDIQREREQCGQSLT